MSPEVLLPRFNRLSAHRRGHSLRVATLMVELAKTHGLDPVAAHLAGWGHDLARELSRAELLAEAERCGIAIDIWEQKEPLLLHGPIASCWLRSHEVGDNRVYQAIDYHTTGGANLGKLAKALFIADGIEPGRNFAARERIWCTAFTSLDQGFQELLHETLAYLAQRQLTPHPNMIAAIDEAAQGGQP